jgi:hypothetical protein
VIIAKDDLIETKMNFYLPRGFLKIAVLMWLMVHSIRADTATATATGLPGSIRSFRQNNLG